MVQQTGKQMFVLTFTAKNIRKTSSRKIRCRMSCVALCIYIRHTVYSYVHMHIYLLSFLFGFQSSEQFTNRCHCRLGPSCSQIT